MQHHFSAGSGTTGPSQVRLRQTTIFASLTSSHGQPSSFKEASGLRTPSRILVTLRGMYPIWGNPRQLTLGGRLGRWEGVGERRLRPLVSLRRRVPPGFRSEQSSAQPSPRREPIARDLAKPSPAEGTVSELLFVCLR